jgi:hypothetical protein
MVEGFEGLEFPVAPCPYAYRSCDKVGTSRCNKECEFHPEAHEVYQDVIKKFEEEPHAIYCLTCGTFLDTKFEHPKEHLIATGLRDFRQKMPQAVIETMAQRHLETGDMEQ